MLKGRIYFVDFARSFAIVLALFDHSMNDFEVWQGYEFQTYALLKSFTSSATPTFLFLFGMMLEIVYSERLKSKGLHEIASKLIIRSFQCYIGYLLTVIAGYIGGLLDTGRFVSSAIFFGNAHFGNILKLYTLMLLLAVPILWLRFKHGILSVLLVALSYWILFPLLKFIPPIQGNIDIFTSFLFGFGGSTGPSVFNSLIIIASGMLVASFISFENPKKFYLKTGIFLIVILSLTFLFVIYISPEKFIVGLTSNLYRKESHPVYYLVGMAYASLVVLAFASLIPLNYTIKKRMNYYLVFGRYSLSSFTLGNIILNLGKKSFDLYNWNFLAPIGFILLIFTLLKIYENYIENISYGNRIDNILRMISVKFNQYYTRPLTNWIANRLNRN